MQARFAGLSGPEMIRQARRRYPAGWSEQMIEEELAGRVGLPGHWGAGDIWISDMLVRRVRMPGDPTSPSRAESRNPAATDYREGR